MRFAIIFLGLFAFVNSEESCKDFSEVKPDLLERIYNSDYDFEDDTAQLYIFCVFLYRSIVDLDGVYNRTAAIEGVHVKKQPKFGKAYDICIEEWGTTNSKRAWNINKCLYHEYYKNDDHKTEDDWEIYKCMEKSGIDVTTIENTVETAFQNEDDKSKNMIFCYLKSFGAVNENGELAIDRYVESQYEYHDLPADQLKNIAEVCATQTGENSTQKAWNIAKCIIEEEKNIEIDY